MSITSLPSLLSFVYFDAAARHCDLSKAAAELGVTSGTISRQIVALEEYLGRLLFLRKNGGMAMTPAGIRYAAQVRQLLTQWAYFAQEQMKSSSLLPTPTACMPLEPKHPDHRTKKYLSRREVEVLRWTAMGKTASEVSSIIGITTRTVNYHIANILLKLDAHNKIQASVRALSLGLI
jgi:DNA-binding CsgD family transcriptional regulator